MTYWFWMTYHCFKQQLLTFQFFTQTLGLKFPVFFTNHPTSTATFPFGRLYYMFKTVVADFCHFDILSCHCVVTKYFVSPHSIFVPRYWTYYRKATKRKNVRRDITQNKDKRKLGFCLLYILRGTCLLRIEQHLKCLNNTRNTSSVIKINFTFHSFQNLIIHFVSKFIKILIQVQNCTCMNYYLYVNTLSDKIWFIEKWNTALQNHVRSLTVEGYYWNNYMFILLFRQITGTLLQEYMYTGTCLCFFFQ